MTKNRQTLLTIVLCLIIGWTARAQADDAGRETPIVSLGVGGRALGMGGAYSALATDASAMHYNPGGLADLAHQEFSFMHTVLFEGTTYNFASWVYPITENHGVGGAIMRLGTEDIVRRDDFTDRGRFDYSYTQMMLAYGRNVGSALSFGTALKIVHQSLDSFSDFGVGADMGARLRLSRHLFFGVIGRDLIRPELKLNTVTERLPRSVAGGLALSGVSLSAYTRMSLSAELEKSDDRGVQAHGGMELRLHDALSLRAGYDRDNIALGVGVEHGRLRFDYAYKVVEWVSDLHHFGVTFNVGMSMAERVRARELALLPPEPTEEEKRFDSLIVTANRYFHKFQLDSAKAYFQLALDMQPDNEEVVGTLAAIEDARRVQEQQEEALRRARDEVTQTLSSFVAQAEQLLSQKMYSASMDLLNLIFDIDPVNVSANELRSAIYVARATEVTESLEEAQRAAAQSRWVDAVESYNRVLELEPQNPTALAAKAQVLDVMDLPEKIRLGIEMFERGRLTSAQARFQAILEVHPDEPVALEYLRRIAEARVQPPPTTTLEDLQKDRVHWDLYLDGLRHMRNKDYAKAIEVWERVLKTYPNNQATLDNIEQARLRLGAQEPEN